MAEAIIGLGASIAGLATFGAQIVTSLRTYASSYARAERKVDDLSNDLALLSSVLTDLGTCLTKYEAKLRFKVELFIEATATCERNLGRLSIALKKMKRNDAEAERAQRKGNATNLGIWTKLMLALGGEKELNEFLTSIERSKSTLQLSLESFHLLVLLQLHDKNEEQKDDFRLLTRKLPVLIKWIQLAEAGYAQHVQSQPKSIIEPLTVMQLSATDGSIDSPGILVASQPINSHISKDRSSPVLSAPKVDPEEPNSPTDQHPGSRQSHSILSPIQKPVEARVVSRNEPIPFHQWALDGAREEGDQRVPGAVQTVNSPNSVSEGVIAAQSGGSNCKNVSRELIESSPEAVADVFETLQESNLPASRHHQDAPSLADSEFHPRIVSAGSPRSPSIDARSLYEGWLLEREPRVMTHYRGLISLCCFKSLFHLWTEDGYSPTWLINPFSRDSAFLKPQLNPTQKKPAQYDIIASIPAEGRRRITDLLRDRNRAAKKSYKWKVAAVSPYPHLPSESKLSHWQKKAGKTEQERFLVILYGGPRSRLNGEHPEVSDLLRIEEDLPERYSNPWAQCTRAGINERSMVIINGIQDEPERDYDVVKRTRNRRSRSRRQSTSTSPSLIDDTPIEMERYHFERNRGRQERYSEDTEAIYKYTQEKEQEYKHRLEMDLRKSNMDERQISTVLNPDKKPLDPNRPTYTRMSRKHLSIEALNKHREDMEIEVREKQEAKRKSMEGKPTGLGIGTRPPNFDVDVLGDVGRYDREIAEKVLDGEATGQKTKEEMRGMENRETIDEEEPLDPEETKRLLVEFLKIFGADEAGVENL